MNLKCFEILKFDNILKILSTFGKYLNSVIVEMYCFWKFDNIFKILSTFERASYFKYSMIIEIYCFWKFDNIFKILSRFMNAIAFKIWNCQQNKPLWNFLSVSHFDMLNSSIIFRKYYRLFKRTGYLNLHEAEMIWFLKVR